MTKSDVITAVICELDHASEKHQPFYSDHEGYAILKEEVDELWDVIKRKPDSTRDKEIREEAIQVAAMALRYLVDLC